MNRWLAKVEKASLSAKEGFLTFWITVAYENGGCQGIGGYALDEYDKVKDKRIGTAYGCEMISGLLNALGVDDFSEMKGKHIWVYGEGGDWDFKPKGLARLKVDGGSEPMIFSDVAKETIK